MAYTTTNLVNHNLVNNSTQLDLSLTLFSMLYKHALNFTDLIMCINTILHAHNLIF